MRGPRLELFAVEGMPEITAGDDLAAAIAERVALVDGDVVIVAQKVVSKAEGRMVAMTRDEAIASESKRVVARRGNIVITETHHGFVCANAGVDESNVAAGTVALLPLDPDASAEQIRTGLVERTGRYVAVIVSDTFGRPWRTGQTNVALGVAGMAALEDLRDSTDRNGRALTATEIAVADEIAAAAELVMGKAEGVPVAILRGWVDSGAPGTGSDLVRPRVDDLFPSGLGGD